MKKVSHQVVMPTPGKEPGTWIGMSETQKLEERTKLCSREATSKMQAVGKSTGK